jgi:general secretion pathway protein J
VTKRQREAGFTLLEVLIALAIAAVIAAMSYQAIEGATGGAERTRDVMAQVNQMDRTWQIIAADMRQVVKPEVGPRGPRFEFKAESLERAGDDVEQVLMTFTRRGWVNPMERLRSDLQQVSYRIAEGKLWRDYLPERNVPIDEREFELTALNQLLLEGVKDVQLRFLPIELVQQNGPSVLSGLDYTRDWEPTWPRRDQIGQVSMPLAVEITIDVEGMGASARLFELTQ